MPQKAVSAKKDVPPSLPRAAVHSELKDARVCLGCCQARRLTFHHLIPKKLHRRQHFRRHFSKQALNHGVMLCRPCHAGVHRLYDEMSLGKSLNTMAALLADVRLQKHFAWVAKLRIRDEAADEKSGASKQRAFINR